MGTLRVDITGQKFGRLTALRFENGFWFCQCECGTFAKATVTKLKNGLMKSCGCLNRERIGALNKKDRPVLPCACGDHVFSWTLHGWTVLVSPEDKNFLTTTAWAVEIGRSRIRRVTNGRGQRLHRLIMGNPEGGVVDHINRNPLDNRRTNLRLCSVADNVRNQGPHKDRRHTKFKGVTYSSRNPPKPWFARFMVKGVTTHLGHFATDREAAEAYDAALTESVGEFAVTNKSLGLL